MSRLLFLLLVPSAVAAQGTPSRAMFGAGDAAYGGAVIVGTLAVSPLDVSFANFLQTHWQTNRVLKGTAHTVETITQPGAWLIGGALYGAGRLAHDRRMAELGLRGTEAITIGLAVTTVTKFTVGRARPDVDRTKPHDFQPLRGVREEDYRSFPSGHSLMAFAAATVVAEETRQWWPGSAWPVGTLMYGGAGAVAVSRMYNNKHWASDVLMGSALGAWVGHKVVKYHRAYPGRGLDGVLLGVSIGPEDGATIARLVVLPASRR